jgi:hypothetical protein
VTKGFESALNALDHLLSREVVPKIMVRASTITIHVFYAFADASGKGLGSGIARSDQSKLLVWIGVWGYAETVEESSNWRKFTNVVEGLEEEGKNGKLTNCIVFLFTDNLTVESALYSGTLSSKKLLGLVLRFKALQTKSSVMVHVSHVAGMRMIVQGTDGVSRGKTNEGVMAGEKILTFIPTHLSASHCSPESIEWIKSWLGADASLLEPMHWFGRGHDITGWTKHHDKFWRPTVTTSKYIWAPAPSAANAALEEFCIARIKRLKSTHVFVCPRLMMPLWLKQLYKKHLTSFSQFQLDMLAGQSLCMNRYSLALLSPSSDIHLGNHGRYRKCTPPTGSCLRCRKTLTWMQGLFCANYAKTVGNWTPCRSIWCGECYISSPSVHYFVASEAQCTTDQNDQERLDHKWKKKAQDEKDKYHVARRGDHLMVSFECGLCIFRKLYRREPNLQSPVDNLAFVTIRRVDLDALWARTKDTVLGNASLVSLGLKNLAELSLTGPYLDSGPLPDYDHCGYEVAMQMVNESKSNCRNATGYKQFDSI